MKPSGFRGWMAEAGSGRHLLLRDAAAGLPGDTPRLDAELLLAAVLGEDRLAMLVGLSLIHI